MEAVMSFYPSVRRLMSLSTLFVLMLLVAAQVSAYENEVRIGLDWGNDVTYQEITIGRTLRLGITIDNSDAHALRADSFVCNQFVGESFRMDSISRLPGTVAAHTFFYSEQYYHAVQAGASEVQCVLEATDLVTGEHFTRSTSQPMPVVTNETRLQVDGYSSTKMMRVGEKATLTVLYTNRSTAPVTNITVSCPEQGRGIVIEGQQQNYTTLRPNESGFTQFHLKAVFSSGSALYLCKVTATDTSTNKSFTVPVRTISIGVYP
jgi:hypothetical protein